MFPGYFFTFLIITIAKYKQLWYNTIIYIQNGVVCLDIQNRIDEQKNKPFAMLLYLVISTLVLLYITMFTVFPMMQLTGIIALGVFCCCYSLLLKKGNFIVCLIAPGISVAAITFVAGSNGDFGPAVAASYINLIFAMIVSAFLNGCTVKKASGSVTFVGMAVCFSVYVVSLLAVVVYDLYGSVSVEAAKKAINECGAFIRQMFSTIPEGLPNGINESFGEEYKKMLSELGKTMEMTFKLTFPTLIANVAMFASAVVFILYKPAAKFAGMANECFEERQWKFNLSVASAVLFEIVFFIYIILSFVSVNAVLKIAFINLVSVLTVPFAYIGLRHLTDILTKKTGTKLAAIVIIACASAFLVLLLGGSIFTLAALIGSSHITKKSVADRME